MDRMDGHTPKPDEMGQLRARLANAELALEGYKAALREADSELRRYGKEGKSTTRREAILSERDPLWHWVARRLPRRLVRAVVVLAARQTHGFNRRCHGEHGR